jgi:hypothetical protein
MLVGGFGGRLISMEAAKAVFQTVIAISAAKISFALAAVALVLIALGLRAWRDDSLDKLADNVLGALGVISITLYLLFVFLFFYFDGFLFGIGVGWWLAALVAVLLGCVFRWYAELNIEVAVGLACLLRLPQPGSIFNDPRVLAAMGEFLRKHSTDSPQPSRDEGSPSDEVSKRRISVDSPGR